MWLCLAAMAVHLKRLDAAQVAYAALCRTDRIVFTESLKVTICGLQKKRNMFITTFIHLYLLIVKINKLISS